MKAKLTAIRALSLCAVPLALASCGTMKIVSAAKEKTGSAMTKLADASVGRLMEPKVPVVEVREKDLKEIPTGDQRIASFEAKKKRTFWFFGGPVDFKDTPLPDTAGSMDGSLLPPIE